MKLSSLAGAFVAVWALIFAHAARADDLPALEGTWVVESIEAGGKQIESPELSKAFAVTVKGDQYSRVTDDGPDGGTLKLDETQTPKALDATDTEGFDVGKVIKAIYELAGDPLRVCYAVDGSERPKEFATKEETPLLLIIYKREKAQ